MILNLSATNNSKNIKKNMNEDLRRGLAIIFWAIINDILMVVAIA